ncbi:unnamed protein product [Musa acuminata subsp. malaccensis]|uniref:(wild Malaysian banana) hypothetical protein n=1 Tax=Musa acuminata subsp. malaccensis TaxID=214687 RepID=A0A804IN64_MUSAM|nr:PREDICTED: uncharacterized protein LOC103981097 [Musa acuminata subsp. malaccensis]CAG1841758.1 unnamed protein product [Musa acuminata subsp. malaccensis]
MASLTPGVLLKLLQSMNTDARVAGEHRSAILQVVGIVPALSASTGDDLWPSHGFYLQLSDSVNSTYVSLSDADADAVLSSRAQLGQLVHVDRLRFAHPVPRAVGLRPVPGARPHPFVGSPDPLVALSAPDHRGFIIQAASPAESGPPLLPSASHRSNLPHLEEEKRTVFAAKENVVVGSGKNQSDAAGKPRRFSSTATSKLTARKNGPGSGNGTGEQLRDPSPALKTSSRPSSPALGGRASSRPSSPVPSKCEVPSLVGAKEDNRRVAREPAIIVPSRYRQPSPVGRKAAASPMGRRGSMSPARRLSGGLKVASPATGDGGGKKKIGLVVAGISRGSDSLVASVKSIRKSWDDSSPSSVVASEPKEKEGSKSKLDKESFLRTQAAISRRLSDAEGVQANSAEASSDEKRRTSRKTESFSESDKNYMAPRITVHDRKWTDGSIPFNCVSDNLARLGKEALQRRSIASVAAAEALEEALVTESVVRSLSMFSELCSLSKTSNPVPTIDRFLSIYDDVLKCSTVAESLCANRNGGDGLKDATLTERSRLASLWVEAALATDLEVIHLLNNARLPKHKASEKQVDPPRTSLSKRQSFGTPAKSHQYKVLPCSTSNTWTRGHGVSETADLGRALRHEMQIWFLRFVEVAIDGGFRLFGETTDNAREANRKDSGKVAAVLSQLKRINDWLDGVGRTADGGETLREKIERLKRKIYGFVIAHVGSAFDTSISLTKV